MGVLFMGFASEFYLKIIGIFLLSVFLCTCAGITTSGEKTSSLASRTQGVAPLAVFFDTINVPGVTQPPEVNGRREYADYHYMWNFGDPESGTWAISGKSKNQAEGHVAAHVFETPGTYTVSLRVTDGTSVDEWHQVDIIVEDPDTFYTGKLTTCISSAGDFKGCPIGAKQVKTTTFVDILSYIGKGRRVLLRRGDSWTTNRTIKLRNSGPLTIGAYGTCASPDSRGICSNAPIVNLTGSDANGVFFTDNQSDFRLMDINFVDNGTRRTVLNGNTNLNAQLQLRLKSTGFDTPFGYSFWNTNGHDQIAYVDCDFYQSRTNILYIGSERLMVMGNRFREPGLSHVLRVWQAYKGVIQYNELSGASATSNAGRHALKLHGPYESNTAGESNYNMMSNPGVRGDLKNRTRWVIVSDNLIGDSGPWPYAIGPQDQWHEENLEDILIENNRFYPGYGTQSIQSNDVETPIKLWARYSTVRNNIITSDGSNYGNFKGIEIAKRGIEWDPVGNRIYNNTFYSPTQKADGAYGVVISSNADGTIVQNNIMQLHGSSSPRGAINDSGTNTTASNNLLTADAGFVDPVNATYTSKDFSLDTGSTAIDNGASVPVFTDIAGVARAQGGGNDLGAYVHK